MKTLTLDEILAGCERAAARVARWPRWMLELSPSTAHYLRPDSATDPATVTRSGRDGPKNGPI